MSQQQIRASALYNFLPQDGTQLALHAGQVVTILNKDESGWWEGYNEQTGEQGIFPSTYVEELDEYQPESGFVPSLDTGFYNNDQPQVDNVNFGQGFEQKVPDKKLVDKPKIESAPKSRGEKTRFYQLGVNMSKLNNAMLVAVGIASIVTVIEGMQIGIEFDLWEIIIFLYATAFGLIMFSFEFLQTEYKPASFPSKTVFYFIFAIPLFASVYTLFNGVLQVIQSLIYYIGYRKQESFSVPSKKGSPKSKSGSFIPCVRIYEYYTNKQKQGKCGKEMFMYLWIIGNLWALLDTLLWWYDEVERRQQGLSDPEGNMFPFTFYLPWARMFGTGLNLSASFILFPVSRTFIRQLYDYSTQDQTLTSRTLRKILWLFPLDKALHFHEKTGWLILFYAFGHSVAHLVNAGLAWSQVLDFYGWSPLVSGFLLWTVMFFLYPAVLPNVKRGQFELFYYTHHVFAIFFFLCIIHGRGTFGPNYWKWFVVPGGIYILERIFREYSAYQDVPLLSVTNMFGKVFSVEFSKIAFPRGYLEGQYVFLNAPFISRAQWHPFTISSAPQDDTVTLHIKVQGPGSWTAKLADYLSLMGPQGASYYEVGDIGPNGVIVGKTKGPTGEKILRLYGPHSAPTQHMPEYAVDIIVGSGIGVTPVSSTLQSIVYHRWKFNIGTSYPDHAYFCWVCSYRDLETFRWMIRIVKEAQDEVSDLRLKNPDYKGGKTFEFHIWVTSVPKDATPPNHIEVADDNSFWGRPRKQNKNVKKAESVFSELDLYKVMLCPPKGDPAQLGDCFIYNGRPKWDGIFSRVANRHPATKIGVGFCGNPRIGADLKIFCRNYTKLDQKQYFVIHKENF